MEQASRRVADRVEDHLAEAERVVASFEARLALGLVDAEQPAAVAAALLAELAPRPEVTELSLTYGRALGYYAKGDAGHEPGELRLAPEGRGQVAAIRSGGALLVRQVLETGGAWRAETRPATGGATARAAAADPTAHDTFVTPARQDQRGHTDWSDLSFA